MQVLDYTLFLCRSVCVMNSRGTRIPRESFEKTERKLLTSEISSPANFLMIECLRTPALESIYLSTTIGERRKGKKVLTTANTSLYI